MCDPVSMATANQVQSAIHIASENNKAVNKYNNELATNYRASLVQLDEQRKQMGAQTQQQKSAIAQKAEQERARLAVLALESGNQGNTAQRIQSTAHQAESTALTVADNNLSDAMAQTQLQAEGMRRQTIANFRQGVTWDGLNLQIQGIELAGQAQNADRIAAEQAKASANSKKPSKFGPQDSIWD